MMESSIKADFCLLIYMLVCFMIQKVCHAITVLSYFKTCGLSKFAPLVASTSLRPILFEAVPLLPYYRIGRILTNFLYLLRLPKQGGCTSGEDFQEIAVYFRVYRSFRNLFYGRVCLHLILYLCFLLYLRWGLRKLKLSFQVPEDQQGQVVILSRCLYIICY